MTLCLATIVSCKNDSAPALVTPESNDPKIKKLKLPEGFRAERLYSPGEKDQGSWVSITFDDKGRMITCDQFGFLYRLKIPAIGDSSEPVVEKMHIGADTTKPALGYAQGLLWAFNSLYVSVNNMVDGKFNKSGLYRVQDTDGDDQLDKVTLLKEMVGDGEHGPHSIKLSPDKQSLYVIAGNHTNVPKMNTYRLPSNWKEDNLFPLIKDPSGHANDRYAPGGWIAHVDSTGKNWELVSAGYRNAFDIAFNEAGDLFVYDSDMEYDIGMPWYRPTRITHATSGSEFGWRTGNSKWSPAYPDNLPALLNIGQGSPTNLVYGTDAKFPAKYRNSLFAFDWSFGIIYAVQLKPEGSSYSAEAEEFISGSPLPLTDGVIGPDGALYFLTGGRRLESDLYRVSYVGEEKTGDNNIVINEENKLRREIEKYHEPKAGAVEYAWKYLNHKDRFIRYAARIAVEHQPVQQWQELVFKEKDPVALTQSAVALARQGDASLKNKLLQTLNTINYQQLSASQKIDLLRAYELVFSRMGFPDGTVREQTIAYLDANYPGKDNFVNRQLSKLLIQLQSPGAVAKTITLMESAKDDTADQKAFTESSDLILRNPQYGLDIANMLAKTPPAQQTYYAVMLSAAKAGWTEELQKKYFKWFANAFTNYRGGHSFVGFIDRSRKLALQNVSKEKFAYYNRLSGDSLLEKSGRHLAKNIPSPKGPGRDWKLEEAVKIADSGMLEKRNFENGKNMFAASMCASCHGMRGEGANVGPNLTQLGTRFSTRDMLEAIIEPNKTVSDQYAATIFTLHDGKTIVGRLINQDADKYMVSQNPFAPQTLREIPKKEVVNTKLSTVSIMMPGMINSLNPEELKDLVAYLMAGGNKEHPVYKK